MRGRRLYGVRIESGDEPIVLELPEDDLSKAADADIAEWQRSGRTTAVHQTITFHGDQADAQGRPSPLFHYLIVAKPGPGRDSGMASVISLSEARATGTAQGPSQTIRIDSGGPIAALDAAEAALSERHRGMHKIVGPRRP
jgi:hypothetical protein